MCNIKAYIFDLDGVVVDTAKYHYLAWRRLAGRFGYEFTEKDNEQFKGVSRMECMRIMAGLIRTTFSEEESIRLADLKNHWYIEYISQMKKEEVLPGVVEFIRKVRDSGGKTALASASKNAAMVLERLELTSCFDAVVDGTHIQRSKPDPQVFQLAAERLGINESDCIVFEDAQAGIDAAKRANMLAVGIGNPENPLSGADIMRTGFENLHPHKLLEEIQSIKMPACQ